MLPPRTRRLLTVLLGVTLLLWLLAGLFILGLWRSGFVWLTRSGRNWVTFSAMALCPLAALVVGVRANRAARSLRLRMANTTSLLLVVAFVGCIGVPLAMQALEERTPENPTTPRPIPAQVGLPVFPGAEGFGTRTPAGRGGKVLEVTSLADNGPGTLREAVDTDGARIIVFRVGGVIDLDEALFITRPNVTIAGQTAPGGGVCIRGVGIVIAAPDVLVQHLRIRPGNRGKADGENNDAISIFGKHGDLPGARNVVIDHVSASWGEDETISAWFGAHDITICWSIVSEALNRSRHPKETHSAGLLIGDGSYFVSLHRNLLAHNGFRNPLIIGGGTHDVVNNVIYDWGEIPSEVVDTRSNSFLAFVGNCYKRGPSTTSSDREIFINSTEGTPRLFAAGNVNLSRPASAADDWAPVTFGWAGDDAPDRFRARERQPTPAVTTSPALEAFEAVLAGAGATRPTRDAADARVVENTRRGSGRIIDSPDDVGGYPAYDRGTPPPDADHDGMPDAWEIEHRLNPADPSDNAGDADNDGYTNIEEYLHALSDGEVRPAIPPRENR
ncbi:MAG: pectate lyase [Planctomycetes bacterium]|nr:pectate lyase [Planctomycetota bacterium]